MVYFIGDSYVDGVLFKLVLFVVYFVGVGRVGVVLLDCVLLVWKDYVGVVGIEKSVFVG